MHGHDDGLKERVARFVSQLGKVPVILHEQANKGRTIIEKFEDETPDADFAIVLLTGDDFGGSGEPSVEGSHVRARQNVVFEFGYFAGMIGRSRVAALVPANADLEFPSDLDGLLRIAVAEDDGWKLKLAKEMKSAGLDVDLNRVVE